jgi:hypothetical protein
MYFLIGQFGGWLMLVLVLGLLVGYLTWSPDRPRSRGWLPVALIAALGALLLTATRVVNGVPALWIETGLLFLAVYLLGCLLGCIIRDAFTAPGPSLGGQGWHSNLGDPAPPLGAAPFAAGGLREPGVRDWHKDLTGVERPPAPVEPARVLSPAPPVRAVEPGGVRGRHVT